MTNGRVSVSKSFVVNCDLCCGVCGCNDVEFATHLTLFAHAITVLDSKLMGVEYPSTWLSRKRTKTTDQPGWSVENKEVSPLSFTNEFVPVYADRRWIPWLKEVRVYRCMVGYSCGIIRRYGYNIRVASMLVW